MSRVSTILLVMQDFATIHRIIIQPSKLPIYPDKNWYSAVKEGELSKQGDFSVSFDAFDYQCVFH